MKYLIIALITAAMLSISPSVEAASTDNTGVAQAAPSRSINKTITNPVTTKPLTRAPSVSVVRPQTKLTPSPTHIYKEATIKPTPILIKEYSIRPICLSGDLQMGEALQIFNEYYDDSEYKGEHKISGIRVTRDRETRETVYQVDLCPIVIYNDTDGNELQASFFVDMSGEIFIIERQMN